MKKIDRLMQELGFKQNAPDSVKEAFIKHLVKATTGVNIMTPSEKKEIEANPERVVVIQSSQQLSFDFIEETRPRSGKSSKKAM